MPSSSPAPASRRGVFILMFGMAFLVIAALLASSRRIEPSDGRLKILCSFLPVYVFTLNVVGDTPDVDVDLLLSPELGCPHDYSLRPGDLVRANRADLIIANGLGAEPFLDVLLANKSRGRVLTISDDVAAIEAAHECGEHAKENGEAHAHSHDGACDHDHAHEHDHAHDPAAGHADHHHAGHYNPHTWVSPAQAARAVRTLGRKLAAADPSRADRYLANAEIYAKKLESLAGRMREASRGFKNRNIVTFHDSFDYLARDLDLNVVATLTVEPDAGISAHQMRELTGTIQKGQVAAIFHEPAYSSSVARSLAEQTRVPAYPLNPFNYVQVRPDAASYERVMEENLRTLQEALGK